MAFCDESHEAVSNRARFTRKRSDRFRTAGEPVVADFHEVRETVWDSAGLARDRCFDGVVVGGFGHEYAAAFDPRDVDAGCFLVDVEGQDHWILV